MRSWHFERIATRNPLAAARCRRPTVERPDALIAELTAAAHRRARNQLGWMNDRA
jgi:hypothetical protein